MARNEVSTLLQIIGCAMTTCSHTAAARAGVDNLTKSLAVEWAPYGIRVNSVAPVSRLLLLRALLSAHACYMQGFIYSSTAEAHYDDPKLLTSFAPYTPAKRLGSVEEVWNWIAQRYCSALTLLLL